MYSVLAETGATAPGDAGITSLPDLLDYARTVLDKADFARVVDEAPPRPHESKYLDVERWLGKLWQSVVFLGLAQSPPLRILDIGTGAGHFPFICRALGHEVVGLDRGDSAFFKASVRWMGVEPIDHIIRPFAKLPSLGGRFDLVTAFRIGFNLRPDRTAYDLPEWSFFLDNIADDVLKPDGTLCLKFNVSPNRVGRKLDDPELRTLFAERGAAFSGMSSRYVTFNPLRRSAERLRVAAA